MTPSLVIDSSIALAWCFLDEGTPYTRQLLERMQLETAAVPGLWFLELSNVLVIAQRKNRIDAKQVSQFIELIDNLSLDVDEEAPLRAFNSLMPLCHAHQLTSYDAVYLDLALRRGLPLATLDDELRRAASNSGVATL